MRHLISFLLHKIPYISNLHREVNKQGLFPAGHYYSPIPDKEEILSYFKSIEPPEIQLPGIQLNQESQLNLLHEYVRFYQELPFPKQKETDYRYYYENDWYSYADAIFLYCFLRKNKPNRIIEVGSGFSSAVMLDTIDIFFSHEPEITFIEPYPEERLTSLLKEGDRDRVQIIDSKVQEVSSEVLLSLEKGDFLFIDSSHVVKCGNDLQALMFEILPLLPAGVFVHFHAIFYPFEYPSDWLIQGRYWNENYLLRAFLSYNSEWSIYFFNTYVALAFNAFIKEAMPLCTKNPGGSLYIQRGA